MSSFPRMPARWLEEPPSPATLTTIRGHSRPVPESKHTPTVSSSRPLAPGRCGMSSSPVRGGRVGSGLRRDLPRLQGGGNSSTSFKTGQDFGGATRRARLHSFRSPGGPSAARCSGRRDSEARAREPARKDPVLFLFGCGTERRPGSSSRSLGGTRSAMFAGVLPAGNWPGKRGDDPDDRGDMARDRQEAGAQ
jgi:hypothetical protein